MKKHLILLFAFVLILIPMTNAATQLLCINNGDRIQFSKCNPSIPDRICQTDQGCRYCVNEIRPGIYCPLNINQCNGQGFTCESPVNPPANNQNDNSQDNQDNIPQNNQNNQDNTNNQQTNTNNPTNNLEPDEDSNNPSVSAGSAITSNPTSRQLNQNNNQNSNLSNSQNPQITGSAVKEEISVKKSSILTILAVSLIFETIIIFYLLKRIKKNKEQFKV